MKKIIILGATGGCLDILNLIEDIKKKKKKFKILGFLDDKFNNKSNINGYKILGKFSDVKKYEKESFFATAIGNAKNFKKIERIIKKLNIKRIKFPKLFHPSANISKYSKIGYGTIIFQNSSIGMNVEIGDFVNILPNCVINHDCKIDSFSKLNSICNLGGSVKIGKSCYIGSGTNIKEKIIIGNKNLIGMSSVILKSFNGDNLKIYGFPASVKK